MNPSIVRRPRERGSAYIIALLVLVVLSILGLSLTLVTQTEVQISSNELTTHRSFYGAETGTDQGLSRLLLVNSTISDVAIATGQVIEPTIEPMSFTVDEVRLRVDVDGNVTQLPVGPTSYTQELIVSPFVPIRDTCCDLCPCAEGDVTLANTNHAAIATAQRVIAQGGGQAISSQKRLFIMVGLQPWWPPRWESIADDSQTQAVVQDTLGGFDESMP